MADASADYPLPIEWLKNICTPEYMTVGSDVPLQLTYSLFENITLVIAKIIFLSIKYRQS